MEGVGGCDFVECLEEPSDLVDLGLVLRGVEEWLEAFNLLEELGLFLPGVFGVSLPLPPSALGDISFLDDRCLVLSLEGVIFPSTASEPSFVVFNFLADFCFGVFRGLKRSPSTPLPESVLTSNFRRDFGLGLFLGLILASRSLSGISSLRLDRGLPPGRGLLLLGRTEAESTSNLRDERCFPVRRGVITSPSPPSLAVVSNFLDDLCLLDLSGLIISVPSSPSVFSFLDDRCFWDATSSLAVSSSLLEDLDLPLGLVKVSVLSLPSSIPESFD